MAAQVFADFCKAAREFETTRGNGDASSRWGMVLSTFSDYLFDSASRIDPISEEGLKAIAGITVYPVPLAHTIPQPPGNMVAHAALQHNQVVAEARQGCEATYRRDLQDLLC